MTKKSLDNPYRKTLQNKKITCFNRCLFNKVLLYILYYKDMVKPSYIKIVQRIKKKCPFADGLQSSCSCKFCKIHRKTPVLESHSNKVAGIKRVHRKCFPMSYFF